MSSYSSFLAQEITSIEKATFAAPLLISTIGFIIYGINLCQLIEYFTVSAKRDHPLTKAWVVLVMIFNTASIIYEVYYNWIFGITAFETSRSLNSRSSGTVIVLYSVAVMLVQLFWLSCIKKSMASRPKLSWIIITPLALISFSSFVNAITLGVLSRTRPAINGVFPTPLISILLRVVLGLDLGVDLSILIVLVTQLTLMKRNTVHHKSTISKLSWILIGTTITSSLIMIAELFIDFPPPVDGSGLITFVITFAPLIPPVYCFGMLAVLNARSNLWPKKRKASPQVNESRSRWIPGLRFTVDLPDARRESVSQEASVAQSTMTFANIRERREQSASQQVSEQEQQCRS